MQEEPLRQRIDTERRFWGGDAVKVPATLTTILHLLGAAATAALYDMLRAEWVVRQFRNVFDDTYCIPDRTRLSPFSLRATVMPSHTHFASLARLVQRSDTLDCRRTRASVSGIDTAITQVTSRADFDVWRCSRRQKKNEEEEEERWTHFFSCSSDETKSWASDWMEGTIHFLRLLLTSNELKGARQLEP